MIYAELYVKGGKFQLEKEILSHLQDKWIEQVNPVALWCWENAKRSCQEGSSPKWQEKLGTPVTAEKNKINISGTPERQSCKKWKFK